MEKAFGEVNKIKGDMAEVLIERGSMCGENCSSCGMCEKRKYKILAKNNVGAKAGDKVVLGVSASRGLKAATLVYAVPVIILIAATAVLLSFGISEGTSVLTAFCIMAVWFFGVFIADKRGIFKEKISAEITEIKKRV